jgi:hypothetical protein
MTQSSYIPAVWILSLWSLAAFAQTQQPQGAITPAYPAKPSEERTVTITYHYRYEERIFTPPVPIEAVALSSRTFDTPESAFIARVSGMKESDYKGWLTTWDVPSRLQLQQRAQEPGFSPQAMIDQWRGILDLARMTMVRSIKTGSFIILTYKVINKEGKDIGQLELPSVFHLVDDRWMGTQELSRDFLLLESPWITGATHVERTAK